MTNLSHDLTNAAMFRAPSSLMCDSVECSSSARSCSRCRRKAGNAYAGFRGAKRPTSRIAMSLTSGFSSFSVTKSARSASAWPKCESVDGHGRQNDASTALRTPASRSETATARSLDMINSSVPADQP